MSENYKNRVGNIYNIINNRDDDKSYNTSMSYSEFKSKLNNYYTVNILNISN